MSALTNQEVEKVLHLARLTFHKSELGSEQEFERFKKELSNILELVDKLKAVDTTGVVPLAHPLDITQPLRKDVVTETNQRELLQRNAPEVLEGFYIVPKVVD